MNELKYKRILLKVSGEALGEKSPLGDGFGLDFAKIAEVAQAIKECVDMGVQVGLVIGGGNFWRGVKNGTGKMQRSHADSMGMLATVMNAIAVADVLEQHGMEARVLFAAGTGNPYFSTDTGAVLRGVEIEADAILMAKNIDGIYSADPKKDPTAVKYDNLTYNEVLEKGLKATDVTAMALAMDNDMPMVCFGLAEENSILRVVRGEKIGTTVTN